MSVQTKSVYDLLEALPPNSALLLYEVSWAEYEDLLELLDENPRFRLSYDQGTLQIMTTSARHERLKSLFPHLLTVLAEELDTNLVSLGSTTFRLAEAARGLEPDDCYYVEHIERIADRDTIDLTVDPPPDLVIEIDITHPSLNKLPIYASFKVPEIWRYTGQALHILRFDDTQYREIMQSAWFPFVSAETLTPFLQQGIAEGIIPMVRAFRAWVRGQQPAS